MTIRRRHPVVIGTVTNSGAQDFTNEILRVGTRNVTGRQVARDLASVASRRRSRKIVSAVDLLAGGGKWRCRPDQWAAPLDPQSV